MWPDIIAGVIVVVLMTGIARYTVNRMNSMEEEFVTRKEKDGVLQKNDERYERILKDLDKGDEKFEKLQEILVAHGELLSSIDSTMKLYRDFMKRRCREMAKKGE